VTAVATVLGAALLLALIWATASYNRFVRQRTLVEESWGDIDVELSRRWDLVPRLVETVKGYAAHEREVLELLVRAREAAAAHREDAPRQRAAYEEGVGQALDGVLARVEDYPDLKASASFLSLQRELTLTEDRIAAARRFYNGNVRAYNTRIATVPSNLIASLGDFERRDFFELSDPAHAAVPDAGRG
jgi:LemA protein